MTVIHIDGHPRQEDLAAYVDDTLELARVEPLEAHVFECSVCASRLQRAASWQLVLHDAAASLEAPVVVAPDRLAAAAPRRSWLRRNAGAMSALWTAAAAVALVVVQQGGGVALDAHAQAPAQEVVAESRWSDPSVGGCGPTDPRCTDGLLASIDPLQSVDPLSTWPDDAFTSAGWSDDPQLEGEPCGSGEDGGPLVCRPFSG